MIFLSFQQLPAYGALQGSINGRQQLGRRGLVAKYAEPEAASLSSAQDAKKAQSNTRQG